MTTTTGKPRSITSARARQRATADPLPAIEPAPAGPDGGGDDLVAVQLTIVFQVDGVPTLNAQFNTAMPRLPAHQDAMAIQVALDARALMQVLEPHVGPSSASAIAAPAETTGIAVPKPGL